MGWKVLKEAFSIEHQVTVENELVKIGSDYVSDLITIEMKTGKVKANDTFVGFLSEHYPKLKEASPEDVLKLLNEQDTFDNSIPVYTYTDVGEILEKHCEEVGYPNVTHDGLMMYENKFSCDKQIVIEWAKSNLMCAVQWFEEDVERAKKELATKQAKLTSYKSHLDAFLEKHSTSGE